MQPIYIDTNYFLRLIHEDVAEQYVEVVAFFKSAQRNEVRLVTSAVTVFEIYWVLKSVYDYDKNQCIAKLRDIFELKILIENRPVIEYALELWPDFSGSLEDCFHLSYALRMHCGKLATFDKKLSKLSRKLLVEDR